MKNKLLEDAKASGFDIGRFNERIYAKDLIAKASIEITEELTKFAALQQPQWISVDKDSIIKP